MSGSESSSLPLPARPSIDDRDVWRIYWQQLGQPWRTEPEINEERQKDLAEPVGAIPPYKVSLNVEHLLRSMVRPYCPHSLRSPTQPQPMLQTTFLPRSNKCRATNLYKTVLSGSHSEFSLVARQVVLLVVCKSVVRIS
jgi:hypothetical protein